jgi:flagella basal body P-ring formation protein FlgA
MIRATMRAMIRSTIATAAVLLALASSAAAQNAVPALKTSATVTSDVVRIGDLVENAGPVADIPIFRAPDLGTTGAVATDRIVEAIRPHQLIDIDTRGLAQVIVTRASRPITAQEISESVAHALAGQNGIGAARNIQVSFDQNVRTLEVEPTVTGDLRVMALAYDPRTTRFDVTLDLPGSAELRRQTTRYTGTAVETVDAVTVDHPIDRGQVLQASDLTILRRPKAEAGGLISGSAAVGLAARRSLRPGQPLHSVDLMKPQIVQHNDPVTIVYEAPGVTLTLRGTAQDTGALGDTIGVLNAESKRVVQGVVVGPGRVAVSAVTTRLVENAPNPARVPVVMAPETTE